MTGISRNSGGTLLGFKLMATCSQRLLIMKTLPRTLMKLPTGSARNGKPPSSAFKPCVSWKTIARQKLGQNRQTKVELSSPN